MTVKECIKKLKSIRDELEKEYASLTSPELRGRVQHQILGLNQAISEISVVSE